MLAQLIATAISKDEEVLKEIVDLLPTTEKDDGTDISDIDLNQEVQSMPFNH
jgi:hypothetical protein